MWSIFDLYVLHPFIEKKKKTQKWLANELQSTNNHKNLVYAMRMFFPYCLYICLNVNE